MFFDDEPLQKTPKAMRKPDALKRLHYEPKQRYFLTPAEVLSMSPGTELTCDTEQFSNYQLIAFKVVGHNGYFFFRRGFGFDMDYQLLRYVLYRYKIITFNGIRYDMPIIEATLGIAGVDGSIEGIKDLSDAIILRNELPEWTYRPNRYNHVDIAEVLPLQGSLKLYAARLNCARMQEMPIDPHIPLTWEEAQLVDEYCFNDLDNTELNYLEVREQIVMRESIGAAIEEDVRSKSDAQLAEATISKEYERLTGRRPLRPKQISYAPVGYRPPAYLQFKTPLMQDVLERMKAERFRILPTGYVSEDNIMKGLTLPIGNNVFRMSIGGLHSSETKVALRADDTWCISDFDVASYYPKIILNGGLTPPSMGSDFLKVYGAIVDRRLTAKDRATEAHKRGDKVAEKLFLVESDGLKITINGTFGKFGNPYSIMYSPELMLYVTLTGQLTLLLLIEHAALEGFEIVSANTDGVVFRYPHSREAELQAIVQAWQEQTAFKLEKTSYVGYFARDVNNYMTLKASGEWKTKGAYCERGSAQNSVLSRNPEAFVCIDAVKALIRDRVPIEKTIRECNDWRRFVSIKNVKGGAHKNGYYLGKVVRWYYAEGVYDAIYSVLSGNQVADTLGARPLMEANDNMPTDVDYQWYINAAFDILADIGYLGGNEQQRLFKHG